jgi:hypothetical protein
MASAWCYTEITEYLARDAFKQEIIEYMGEGDRFTLEDGERLQAQILELERQLLIHYRIQNREAEE